MKKFWVLPILLPALTGCAVKFSPEQVVKINEDDSLARISCYEYLEKTVTQEVTYLRTLTPEQAFAYLNLKAMQEGMVQIASAITGHSTDQCSNQYNVFQYLADVVKEEHETIRSVSGDLLTLGKWGVGGYFIKETVDGIVENSGPQYNMSDNARMDSSANTASVGRDGDARSSTSESVDFSVDGTAGASGSLDNSKPTTVTNNREDIRTTTITRTNSEIEN